MATNFRLSIPVDARILISFRVHANEIPKDEQGRLVFQTHQAGSGCGKPGKIVFGGYENPHHVCTQLSLDQLIEMGFRINNLCVVVDKKNDQFYWVRTWLNHRDEGGLDMKPEDWLEAGEFVRLKLSGTFNKVTVYDNGEMFSINMVDRARDPKWILRPCLAGKSIQSAPVEKKVAPQVAVISTVEAKSAMALAFGRLGVVVSVDGGSASAAEITASVLEQSLGKSIHQEDLDSNGRTWSQVLCEEDATRSRLFPES